MLMLMTLPRLISDVFSFGCIGFGGLSFYIYYKFQEDRITDGTPWYVGLAVIVGVIMMFVCLVLSYEFDPK